MSSQGGRLFTGWRSSSAPGTSALLLGADITAEMLNDDAIGRVLDRIYEYGTWKIFSEVCVQAFRSFGVDCSVVHHDTTSVSVWGEYKPAARRSPPHHARVQQGQAARSQAVRALPSLRGGQSSLPRRSALRQRARQEDQRQRSLPSFPGSWRVMEKRTSSTSPTPPWRRRRISPSWGRTSASSHGCRPTSSACGLLIREAVASGSWVDVGQLSHRTVKGKEICAAYRLHETRSTSTEGRTGRSWSTPTPTTGVGRSASTERSRKTPLQWRRGPGT